MKNKPWKALAAAAALILAPFWGTVGTGAFAQSMPSVSGAVIRPRAQESGTSHSWDASKDEFGALALEALGSANFLSGKPELTWITPVVNIGLGVLEVASQDGSVLSKIVASGYGIAAGLLTVENALAGEDERDTMSALGTAGLIVGGVTAIVELFLTGVPSTTGTRTAKADAASDPPFDITFVPTSRGGVGVSLACTWRIQ